jgi:N-acyl-L-homoserine lactone synthetase
MLSMVNFENSYQYGAVLKSLFKLRYEQFFERQNYETYVKGKREFDRYDTYATNYIIYRDENDNVLGTSRKAPTTMPYMIEEIWPYLIKGKLPKSDRVWESSRFCIDKNTPHEKRKDILVHLVAAGQRFGIINDVDYFVGVMHPAIWRSVFIKNGWPVEALGDVHILEDGSKVLAAKMPVSQKIMHDIDQRNNINYGNINLNAH